MGGSEAGVIILDGKPQYVVVVLTGPETSSRNFFGGFFLSWGAVMAPLGVGGEQTFCAVGTPPVVVWVPHTTKLSQFQSVVNGDIRLCRRA